VIIVARARHWKDVKAEAIERGQLTGEGLAEARRAQDARIRAYRLAQVRQAQHVNQTELAQRMQVSQSRVSRIERGELSATETGTLASYVEALGGTLEIVADFGDQRLVIG
jgi:DNA-binding transcriptional regulator YiaG